MKVLFVCTVNRYRSRTAEHHFRMFRPEHEYRSCGTDVEFILEHLDEKDKEDTTPISRELCEWADVILAMESKHSNLIKKNFGMEIRRKTTTLNVRDIYDYMDARLIDTLEEKVRL